MPWMILAALTAHANPLTLDEVLGADGWEAPQTFDTAEGPVTLAIKRMGDFDCLQATATTDLAPGDLLDTSADVASLPSWSTSGIAVSEILAEDADGMTFVQVLDLPWFTFVADRFWTVDGTITESEGTATFTYRTTEDATLRAEGKRVAKDAFSGAKQAPFILGAWEFTDNGDQTQAMHASCADFGMAIPAAVQTWIAQTAIPQAVSELFAETRRRSQD